MSPRIKAYLYMTLVSVIWGVAGPVIKFTLGGLPTLPFLTYRFFLSSLGAIFLFLLLGKKGFPKKEDLPAVLLYGFLTSTVALGLLFFGMEKTTVLDMTFISAVNPLLIAVAGVIIFKEHITSREKVGMTIAFIGTLLTIIQPVLEDMNLSQLGGNILVVLYVVVNTASVVLVKKLVRKSISPLVLTNISFIIGFLSILPAAFIFSPDLVLIITSIRPSYHAGVFFMALISGNLAYTLWAKGQKTIEIGDAALFTYLYPVFSAPLAVWWLNEKISLPFILGVILISIGVAIAELKKAVPK